MNLASEQKCFINAMNDYLPEWEWTIHSTGVYEMRHPKKRKHDIVGLMQGTGNFEFYLDIKRARKIKI